MCKPSFSISSLTLTLTKTTCVLIQACNNDFAAATLGLALINQNFTIDRNLGDLRRGFPIGFPSIQSLQTMKRERVGFLFVTMMWNYLCYTLDSLDF
jgi:hypothetical protein